MSEHTQRGHLQDDWNLQIKIKDHGISYDLKVEMSGVSTPREKKFIEDAIFQFLLTSAENFFK